MARILPFPPRRAGLYDPLISGATLASIDRALEQERRKAKLLADAGYRRTFGDWLTETFEASFASGFIIGFIAGILLVIVPFVIGARL